MKDRRLVSGWKMSRDLERMRGAEYRDKVKGYWMDWIEIRSDRTNAAF